MSDQRFQLEFGTFTRALIYYLKHGPLPLDEGERASALNLTRDELAQVWPRLPGWHQDDSGYRHAELEEALDTRCRMLDDRQHLLYRERLDAFRGEPDDLPWE